MVSNYGGKHQLENPKKKTPTTKKKKKHACMYIVCIYVFGSPDRKSVV